MVSSVKQPIELARWADQEGRLKIVTVADYYIFLEERDKIEIANFIYNRLHSRYLKPFLFNNRQYIDFYKNGFLIMANCCLLIETLQSFKNGWKDSKSKSGLAFKQFLSTHANFSPFKNKEEEFYVNIRCGILHQGETTGGWRINREGGTKLFDKTNLVVNSIAFVRELDTTLKEYKNILEASDWNSKTWINFRNKMENIIKNCQN